MIDPTLQPHYENVLRILTNAKYQVVKAPQMGVEICFEFLAFPKSQQFPSLVVKIVDNIDTIRPYILNEIYLVSYLLAAFPLIIGLTNRHSTLQNGSIYVRKELFAVNQVTLEQIMQNPQISLAFAKQGGFFLNINGERLEELRESHNLSRTELAKQLGLSTKAIAQYERNNMRASMEHAQKIKEIFHESITIPIDFFFELKNQQRPLSLDPNLQKAETIKTQEFIKSINEIIDRTEYQIFWSRMCPFDLIIYKKDKDSEEIVDTAFIAGAHLEKNLQDPKRCIQRTFIKDFHSNGGMVYDDEVFSVKEVRKEEIPYCFPKDLKALEHPEEFKRMMRERDRRAMNIQWQS